MSIRIEQFEYPDLNAAIQGTQAPAEIVSTLELVPVDYIDSRTAERVTGQLVVAAALAEDVQEIFGTLRDAEFPISSIIPIAAYDDIDHASIADNNTSAFCYRPVAGTDRLSKHSFGTALDLNPLWNPYVNLDGTPKAGSFPYKGYDRSAPGTITENGIVVRAFLERGWQWGGHWDDFLDYQHFNKD
jgi:peptidoglycan LD-endopeptidase CwlK